MKVFIISSVRNAPQSLRDKLEDYSRQLDDDGHQVYLPHRDTNSSQPSLEIVRQNKEAIAAADEIHVYYNPDSQGSHFELGVAFALNKNIRVIENIDYPEGKSFARVIDEWQAGGAKGDP